MFWDGMEIKQAQGDPLASQPAPRTNSADFTGQCRECGCQIDELLCVKPDCDGCTVEIENETCRHAFTHRVSKPAVDRHVTDRWRPVFRMSFRKHARSQGDQLDACADRTDRIHDESIMHTLLVDAPDADKAVRCFHGRQFPAQHAYTHTLAPSLVSTPASVAEAGKRATLPGGGTAR